ncbi:MAG TPA: PQQ-binding-like beta-propeller repeat protein [Anaerolineales bacterium]|nr:PQQ-binding-like beta-propeller repeat protein [Anaerolineales bacterium]
MKPPKKTRRLIIFELLLLTAILSLSSFSLAIFKVDAATSSTNITYLPIVERSLLYDWLQFGGDPSHSGNNTMESSLSPSTVGNLQLHFQVSLPGIADGAPAYLTGVSTPSGTRDLIYVTTRDGYIAALDAHTGILIWSKRHGPGSCLINNNPGQPCYTTSSPAIDPNRQFIYSYGLDGYVHKYRVGSGLEITTGGWPELTTLKGYDEKGSSALSIATAANGTSYLYVAHAGYPGDRGNYQGHITAINLSNGTQKVFNTLCSNQAVHFIDSRAVAGLDCFPEATAAIWARPGVVFDPYHNRILMSTGNGTFQPINFLWGDTVFSLHLDGSGASGSPLDSYTPSDFQYLQDTDKDLGSTAPAILPLATGNYPHLAVQGGKDGILRLINLDQMSGQPGVGNIGGEVFSMPVPMGGAILTQPAVWRNPSDHATWVFVSNGNGLAALKLIINPAGDPSLVSQWTGTGGTSPLVANRIVYIAHSNLVSALNATDGAVLWSDNHIASIHWESPVVDNGMLYLTDQAGHLNAYSLP